MSDVHEKLKALDPSREAAGSRPEGASVGGSPLSNMAPQSTGKPGGRGPKVKIVIYGLLTVAILALGGRLAWTKIANFASSPAQAPLPPDPTEQARALLEQRRFTDAAGELERLLPHDPKDTGLLINLAYAQKMNGDVVKSEETLRKALDLEPENAVALNNLGQIHVAKTEWDLAISAFQKAVAAKPGMQESLFGMAVAYESKKSWAEAAEAYERLVSVATTLPRETIDSVRDRIRRLKSLATFAANHLAPETAQAAAIEPSAPRAKGKKQ